MFYKEYFVSTTQKKKKGWHVHSQAKKAQELGVMQGSAQRLEGIVFQLWTLLWRGPLWPPSLTFRGGVALSQALLFRAVRHFPFSYAFIHSFIHSFKLIKIYKYVCKNVCIDKDKCLSYNRSICLTSHLSHVGKTKIMRFISVFMFWGVGC